MLTLGVVFEALNSPAVPPALAREAYAQAVITEACIDSRQAIPGSLFVALPGEHVDGHDYVAEAFRKGAQYALVQREMPTEMTTLDLRVGAGVPVGAHAVVKKDKAAKKPVRPYNSAEMSGPLCLRVENTLQALQSIAGYWRSQLKVKVIGITGSVGKSTTKEVVAEVLNQRYRTLKTVGNLNNEIGLPLMLLSLSEGHERAVLEMGFYVPGEIAFLCNLARPEMAVVTNIGSVHAERAGDQETIALGKGELVEALPPNGVAILNYDDPLVLGMAARVRTLEGRQARIFTYGLDAAADLWADGIEGLGLEGIRFRLHYQGETLHLRVPMIGRHSVQTALRAAAVGLADGLDWQEIVEGLRSSPTQLRLMAVRSERGALILDDTYNASPESVLAALNLLEDIALLPIPDAASGDEGACCGQKIAVLGDMLELGIYEQSGHQKVGIRTAEVADRLVAVGPRARMIAEAALNAGMTPESVQSFETTTEAVAALRQTIGRRDVILVKGSRGMRMERVVSALEVGQ